MVSAAILTKIWRPQAANYFCYATKRDGVWRDHYVRRREIDRLRLPDDCDTYFCCHGLLRPVRREAYACESKLLWADLDAVFPGNMPMPTIAWATSRGRFSAIWRCDGEPSRALRKGFNDAIGADRGWNLTKVLRVPGSVNYKYNPPQRGNLIWDDGPVHRLRDLRRYARDDDGGGAGDAPDIKLLDTKAVLAKYEGQFDPTLLDTAVDGKDGTVRMGGRYKIIWKLGMQLKAAGATRNEIGTLLYASAAWQSKNGPNSHGRLAREVDRIMRKDRIR